MTESEWGRPAEIGGEFVKPQQLNGHLVIVYPIGYIPFIPTRFSGQTSKPSDAIAVDVVDLDDKDDYGNPGKVYRNSNFMQAQLIAALKSQIGSKVLGVIALGVARNGMNPPWVIIDMSGDATARERAQAWLAANPNFRPSPFSPREPRPAAPPQPAFQQPQMQYPQMYGSAPTPPQPQQRQPYGPDTDFGQGPMGYPPAVHPQYQQPAQYQHPVPQQTASTPSAPPQQVPMQQYAAVPGSAQLSQDDMTVLQHHRAQRAAAEAEAARQATFNDQPPF